MILFFKIVLILSEIIGGICMVHLWIQRCSILRRFLWSPVPLIPILGPMLYYALFEPPSVQPEDMRAPENPYLSG
jgi:hypothetical protein